MTIKEILNTTNHRPWKIPSSGWKFYQEWNNAIFLHYRVELKELKKFVPKELVIDLFEGKPWVSLVAFIMEKIRPKIYPLFLQFQILMRLIFELMLNQTIKQMYTF